MNNCILYTGILLFLVLALNKVINVEKFSRYDEIAQLDILDHINVPTRAYCPTSNQSYDLRNDPVKNQSKEYPFYNSTRKNRCAVRYLS